MSGLGVAVCTGNKKLPVNTNTNWTTAIHYDGSLLSTYTNVTQFIDFLHCGLLVSSYFNIYDLVIVFMKQYQFWFKAIKLQKIPWGTMFLPFFSLIIDL